MTHYVRMSLRPLACRHDSESVSSDCVVVHRRGRAGDWASQRAEEGVGPDRSSQAAAAQAGGRQRRRAEIVEDCCSGHSEIGDVLSVTSGDSASFRSHGRRGRGGARCSARAKRRRGGFRLQGKQFALTYPRCEVERAVFDECFRKQHGPFAEYGSARESHADGGHHMHVFVSYQQRKDLRSARALDVAIDGVVYHGKYEKCRDRADWLRYISKEGDCAVPVAEPREAFDPLLEPIGKRKSKYVDFRWSEDFRTQRSLKPVAFPVRLECEGITYELAAPDPRCKRRSWWIVAPPNAGKTRWLNRTFAGCAIYSPRTGKYPFEGYADQDIIVYDDRSGVLFEEFASVLNTWDIVQPIAGEVRYVTQNWKLGHTRTVIVLSNKTIEESMEAGDVQRMRKRFIQIVNPVLLRDDERSEAEEEPAAAAAAAASAQLYSEFAS